MHQYQAPVCNVRCTSCVLIDKNNHFNSVKYWSLGKPVALEIEHSHWKTDTHSSHWVCNDHLQPVPLPLSSLFKFSNKKTALLNFYAVFSVHFIILLLKINLAGFS